ncbi:MAG TPA: histidine kinase dimerization/phospho-acceptor domain-containing protein, partial [Ktedonobacteraceae bacterium]|nr:histidine kinase dimerization/phospho-acceptor domain-containing protein [Ktedonobacteraceae bacterium]
MPEHIPVSPEVPDFTTQTTAANASSPTRAYGNKPQLLRIAARPYQWFQENTFAPNFLKGAVAHPALGYLVAFVFQAVISAGLFVLVHAYPSFRFPSVPLILVILLVAFGWGAGPGILALLIGAITLIIFILLPIFALQIEHTSYIIGIGFYAVVGLAISIFASNTERARRTSEQLRLRLDTIIDAIPDSLTIYDAEGRCVQQNRVAREIGPQANPPLALAQIADQLQTRRSSGELLLREELPLARALRGEVVVGAELLYRVSVKQQDRLVAISAAPLYTPSGKTIEGAVTITHDLDERKQIEDALRASEEQEHILSKVSKLLTSTLDYQETLANIAHLIVPQLADWFAVDLVNADGQFELIEIDHKDPEQAQWARALREKYPVDPNTPTGLPNVVRTGHAELYPEITDEMLVAGARNEEELALARQIGYSSIMLVPLVARGKTIGVVTFVATESGRKYNEHDLALAEEIGRRAGVALDNARLFQEVIQARDQLSITLAELWRSRQQLEVIFANIADGISVQDGHGKLIFMNEAGARRSGYLSVEDALEAADRHTLRTHTEQRFEILDEQGHPIPYEELPGKRALRGEKAPQAIVQYYDKITQARQWSLVKAQPLIDDAGRVELAITIFSDITESYEEKQRKDEFISMASHELKTPVTSLKGFTQVLQRRLLKQGDEQGLHYLARMDAQLNRLTKLVGDLLDVSKMQAGKLTFDVEPFELDALIQETVENVQATTSTPEIVVEGRTGGC